MWKFAKSTKLKLTAVRKSFTIAAVIAIFIALLTLGLHIRNTFFSEATVQCSSFAKYKIGKAAVYLGELSNNSSTHATELSLKGKFSTEILKLDIDTTDILEPFRKSSDKCAVEFTLKRLSRNNKLLFTIIVDLGSEIVQRPHVSWGKDGSLDLALQDSDPKIQKTFDLYDKARSKWIENNSKIVR